jgi:hypothetical protein
MKIENVEAEEGGSGGEEEAKNRRGWGGKADLGNRVTGEIAYRPAFPSFFVVCSRFYNSLHIAPPYRSSSFVRFDLRFVHRNHRPPGRIPSHRFPCCSPAAFPVDQLVSSSLRSRIFTEESK